MGHIISITTRRPSARWLHSSFLFVWNWLHSSLEQKMGSRCTGEEFLLYLAPLTCELANVAFSRRKCKNDTTEPRGHDIYACSHPRGCRPKSQIFIRNIQKITWNDGRGRGVSVLMGAGLAVSVPWVDEPEEVRPPGHGGGHVRPPRARTSRLQPLGALMRHSAPLGRGQV